MPTLRARDFLRLGEKMEHGEERTGHSRMGVASFVICVLAIVAILALVVGAPLALSSSGAIDPSTFDPANPQSVNLPPSALLALQIVGLVFFAGLLLSFVGLGLGIAGTVQRRRKRLFAVIGTVVNGLVVLGVVSLILLAVVLGSSSGTG